MLSPKRTKYRKAHKGRIHGNAKGGTTLNFGSYGLKAVEPERVTARQIEAARRAITRHLKRLGRVFSVQSRFRFRRVSHLSILRLIHRHIRRRTHPHTGQSTVG